MVGWGEHKVVLDKRGFGMYYFEVDWGLNFPSVVPVAKDGKMAVEFAKYDYPVWAFKSAQLNKLSTKDLMIPASKTEKVRVMLVFSGMVHTTEEHVDLIPKDGGLQSDLARDIAKIAIF